MGKWDFLHPYDEEVLISLAAGDIPKAYDVLSDGYHVVIASYCIALIGHVQDGEDIAQDVFVDVTKSLYALKDTRRCATGSLPLRETNA